MTLSWKHVTRRISLGLSFLLLAMLMAACSGLGTSTSSTSTATSTPISKTATPTPTSVPVPTVALTTYTGASYTIGYPTSWKKQTSGTSVVFQDAQGLNALTISTVPNPEGTQSADTISTASLTTLEQAGDIKDPQPTNLPATTTVGGESWVQKGITGTATDNGVAVPGELVLLVDNHPASAPTTQVYEIYYGGPALTFSSIDEPIFQAMIQSFKFTA
jgi:hypothetical protein